MQDARLPLELHELIIDFTAGDPPGHWWQGRNPSSATSQQQLLQYTAVCTAWLPRTRFHLYRSVACAKLRHFELFLESVTRNPALADLVCELVVLSRSDCDAYIPLARGTVQKIFRRLKTLVYDLRKHPQGQGQMRWPYPPRYHLLLTRFSITDLAIHYPKTKRFSRTIWFETLRLVWLLPHLQSLQLDIEGLRDLVPTIDVQRLEAIRRHSACADLERLLLSVSDTLRRVSLHQLTPPCACVG